MRIEVADNRPKEITDYLLRETGLYGRRFIPRQRPGKFKALDAFTHDGQLAGFAVPAFNSQYSQRLSPQRQYF